MRWPTRACAVSVLAFAGACRAQVSVPGAPPPSASVQAVRDGHYGIRFQVPPGWMYVKKDRQVSTFRLDARTAGPKAELRGVASLQYNPFPLSTLSGALFYYSVEKHLTDAQCARQVGTAVGHRDVLDIGGMDFIHGHQEHGRACLESRDEVYTTYRKGSCYRFDLTVNTFCSASSGAQDLSEPQIAQIEERMANILSSVVFDWRKGGTHAVPAPAIPDTDPRRSPDGPSQPPASMSGGQ